MTDLDLESGLELVTKANERIKKRIKSVQTILDSEVHDSSGVAFNYYTEELNILLAHKAFFERHGVHERFQQESGLLGCKTCWDRPYSDETGEPMPYPCPELVLQAKAIIGITKCPN